MRLPEKRWRIAIPAVLLCILAVYELWMIRWEKTVHGPIRIDLLLEIPLMFVLDVGNNCNHLAQAGTKNADFTLSGRPR